MGRVAHRVRVNLSREPQTIGEKSLEAVARVCIFLEILLFISSLIGLICAIIGVI